MKKFNFKAKTKALISACFFLGVSILSVSVTTFAWFSASMTKTVTTAPITTVKGDAIALRYFKNNITTVESTDYDTGYDFYDRGNFDYTGSTYFESNFISSEALTLDLSYLTPRAALTYAINIEDNTGSDYVSAILSSFSTTKHNTRTDSTSIYLSEAIDVYFSAYYYGASEDLDTIAKNFINIQSPTDTFTSTAGSGSNISLSTFNYTATKKMIIFMTILCSNESSTFYTAQGTSPETYVKSSQGNSNVYKGLDFNVSAFEFEGGTN